MMRQFDVRVLGQMPRWGATLVFVLLVLIGARAAILALCTRYRDRHQPKPGEPSDPSDATNLEDVARATAIADRVRHRLRDGNGRAP
jgi:hypothetical protein